MSNDLMIEVYPDNKRHEEQMDQLIQEVMAEEGVRGMVSVDWCIPEALKELGISRLPAIIIDDEVFLEGRMPTRKDVVDWFDKLVPQDERAPRSRPDRIGWPSSVDEAVIWLVDGMTEKDKLDLINANDEDLSNTNAFPGGWGQGIRNGYGLWADNQALLRNCSTDNAEEASLVIMKAVRDHLKRLMGKEHEDGCVDIKNLAQKMKGRKFGKMILDRYQKDDFLTVMTAMKEAMNEFPQDGLLESWIDEILLSGADPSFWQKDCGVVFLEICELARQKLARHGVCANDEQLFSMFIIIVLSIIYTAHKNPKSKSFIQKSIGIGYWSRVFS